MTKGIGDISGELVRQSVIPVPVKIEDGSAVEIPINQIASFKDHPFIVKDDDAMEMLKESIRIRGIMTPVVVRKRSQGGYELISGHRRVHAARSLKLTTVPAVIRYYSDDEAVIAMVDSNLQRELLPSEKAKAFKMRMDAMKHQGNLRRNVAKLDHSADSIGKTMGISGRQVQRYIKLNGLSNALMYMVDDGRISIEFGGMISELCSDTQKILVDYLESGEKLTSRIIKELKQCEEDNEDVMTVFEKVSEKNIPTRVRVNLSKKIINKYFPESMSSREIETIIEGLLEEWKQKKEI